MIIYRVVLEEYYDDFSAGGVITYEDEYYANLDKAKEKLIELKEKVNKEFYQEYLENPDGWAYTNSEFIYSIKDACSTPYCGMSAIIKEINVIE